MNNKQIAILMGVMCCLLTAGIFIQIKTIKSTTSSFGKTQTENELRDSVSRWQEKYQNAYERLAKKENELEELDINLDENRKNLTELKSKTIWGISLSSLTILGETFLWCCLHSHNSLTSMIFIMVIFYLWCKGWNLIENGSVIVRIIKKKKILKTIGELESKRSGLVSELQRMKATTDYQVHHENEIDWTNNIGAKCKFTGTPMNHDGNYKATEIKLLRLINKS